MCFHVFAQKIRVNGVRALNRLALAQHRIVIAALGQILRQNNEVAFLRVQNCPSLAFFVPSIFFSTQGISPVVGQVAAVFPVQLPNLITAIGKASQFRIGHADEQHKVHMAVRPIQARLFEAQGVFHAKAGIVRVVPLPAIEVGETVADKMPTVA